jgi:hypothetical protein
MRSTLKPITTDISSLFYESDIAHFRYIIHECVDKIVNSHSLVGLKKVQFCHISSNGLLMYENVLKSVDGEGGFETAMGSYLFFLRDNIEQENNTSPSSNAVLVNALKELSVRVRTQAGLTINNVAWSNDKEAMQEKRCDIGMSL